MKKIIEKINTDRIIAMAEEITTVVISSLILSAIKGKLEIAKK